MMRRTGWHALALAGGLEPGTSAGTRLYDDELVIWRDTSGASHVWEDRCPHRGMRLSFGFVRGDHIACLYHGWQYDQAGLCRYIPAHPKLEVPDTIRVATYPSAEALGLLWVWTGEADAATPPPADRAVTPVRSLYVDAAPERVAALLASGPNCAFEAGGDGLYAGTVEGVPVLLALQPFLAGRTALHLVIDGASDRAAALAPFAERLRDALEAAAARLPVAEVA